MLISSLTLSTKADEPKSDLTCYGPQQVSALAVYKKACDVCKLDLSDTQKALDRCYQNGKPSTDWWAAPTVIVGGMALSVSLGVLIGIAVSR